MEAQLSADEVADLLLERLNANKAAEQLSVITVEAPTGWGKSDAVDCFYADLAAVEEGWAYWPRNIGEGRKQLFPAVLEPDPGSRMEFFWWGLRGQVDGWDVRCAALDADEQLQRLAVPIADALGKFDDRWWARLRALWSAAGVVLPQLGSVPHLIELMLQAKELYGVASEWADAAKAVRDAIAASEEMVERARLAPDERDPIRTDRAQQARRSAVVAGQVLCRVSRLLPVVIAVEDAQLLDQQTVDLLRTVAASDESVGLIVLTIAPDRPTRSDSLRVWLRELERDQILTTAETLISRRLLRVNLTALPERDLRRIAVDRLTEEQDADASVRDSPVIAAIAREVGGSPLLLHRLLDSPAVLDAIEANDTTVITPAVLVAAGDGDGRAEAWRLFPPEVRKGLCVVAVMGLLTEREWLDEQLEQTASCADLATLFSVSSWLVQSNELVSFLDSSGLLTASAQVPFELGAHAGVVRRQLCVRIRNAQQEGSWTKRPLLLRLEALQGAVTDAKPDDDCTDLAIELAELQGRTGQSRARRLPVLNYLLDTAAEDSPLSSPSYSAVAVGYLDLGELDQAIIVLRERLHILVGRRSEALDDEVLLVRHELARVLKADSQFTEAIDLLEQVLAARYARIPINLDRVRATERDLYDCLSAVWRWDRALAVATRRYEADQAALGDQHWTTVSWGGRLYTACRYTGRSSEAIDGYERLVRDAHAAFGATAQITFDLRSDWAAAMLELGSPEARGRGIKAYTELLADQLLALGEDHPDTLTTRSHLAHAHESAGQLDKAIPLYERTLTDRERVLGPDHPDTLTARNDLAAAYLSAGRLDEAIPLYERTLIDRERLSPDHPDTLSSRNNLAYAYQSVGRLDEAIPLLERTLADRQRMLGADHPNTLTTRNNLAAAYQSAGRLDEAVPLLERTLADRQRLLGPDHPETLISQINLASTYRSVGRLNEALPMLERTLADCERVLGPDHPHTLAMRNNLAVAYQSAGRLDEAIPLLERTLADGERLLGADHPNTLSSRNNLADAFQSAGRLEDAIPLYERTLTDRERVFGPDHPDTLASRNNLAVAYQSAARLDEAIPLLARTLAGNEGVLGRDHPYTLAMRNNLAVAYQSAGRLDEAIPLLERTLADCERVLGPDNLATLITRNSLADAYQSAGRLEDAIPLYERTLTDRERVLGADHPDTLASRNNLARLREDNS